MCTVQTIRKTEKQSSHVKERKAQGKVCDVTEPPRKTSQQLRHQDAAVTPRPLPLRASARPPKPVDEDLYKIPPELLRTSKRVGSVPFLSVFFSIAYLYVRTTLTDYYVTFGFLFVEENAKASLKMPGACLRCMNMVCVCSMLLLLIEMDM